TAPSTIAAYTRRFGSWCLRRSTHTRRFSSDFFLMTRAKTGPSKPAFGGTSVGGARGGDNDILAANSVGCRQNLPGRQHLLHQNHWRAHRSRYPERGGAMNRDDLPDEETMARVAAGRSDLLERLVRRHSVRLLTFICRLVGDSHRGEELFQDVFLAVWTK